MLGKKIKLLTITLLTLLSTVSLHAYNTQYSATVCGAGNYLFGCQVITPALGSGDYTDLVKSDSTVTLHLLFAKPVTAKYTATVEPGQKYLFGCQVIDAGADETVKTDVAQDVLSSAAGCDSTVILTLKVQKSAVIRDTVRAQYTAELDDETEPYLLGCKVVRYTDNLNHTFSDTITLSATKDSIIFVTLKLKAAPQRDTVRYQYTAEMDKKEDLYLFGCEVLSLNGKTTASDTINVAPLKDSIIFVTLKLKAAPVRDTVRYSYIAKMEKMSDKYLFGCQVLSLDDVKTASDTLNAGDHDSIITVTLEQLKRDTVRYSYIAKMEKNSDKYLFGCRVLSLDDVKTASDTLNAGDHDSIITVTLEQLKRDTVRYSYIAKMDKTSDKYLFGCNVLSLDDVKTASDTLNAGDHDSIITVTLEQLKRDTVRYSYIAKMDKTSDKYLFGCQVLSLDDVKTASDTLNAGDHDSIISVTLSLKQMPVVKVQYSTEIQVGDIYLFGCKTYQYADAGPQTLKDTIHLTDKDSITFVNLTVTGSGGVTKDTVVAYSATIKPTENYLFGCRQLTLPGEYKDTLPRENIVGDSITVLTLKWDRDTVRYTYTAKMDKWSDKYLFGCQVLSLDGLKTASDTLNAGDHDSIITVTLEQLHRDTVRYEYTAKMDNDNDLYLFGCEVLSLSGSYKNTASDTINAGDHDSIITVTLALNCPATPITGSDNIYVCKADLPYHWTKHDYWITKDSTFFDTIPSILYPACDSIITIKLSVGKNDTVAPATKVVECGDHYYWTRSDSTYLTSGIHYFAQKNPGSLNVCDSLVYVLDLTLRVADTIRTADTICYNSDYDWLDKDKVKTIKQYKNMLASKLDTIHVAFADDASCDSILYTLNLTVLAKTDTIISAPTVCEGEDYTWKDKNGTALRPTFTNLTADKKDTVTFQYPNSTCDSIVYILNLKVQPRLADVPEYARVCIADLPAYKWRGKSYTASCIDHDTVQYVGTGCDSISYTLHLTVLDKADTVVVNDTVCYETDYTWFDVDGTTVIKTFTKPTGSLKDTAYRAYAGAGCDSVVHVLRLFVYPKAKTIHKDDKVGFGADYVWLDQDGNALRTYTEVEQTINDQRIISTADHKCDSIIYTLTLKVADIDRETTEISATVCAGSTYYGRLSKILVTSDTVWTDSLRVKKDVVKVDSIYTYRIYVYRDPSILPDTLLSAVRAVCGHALDTAAAETRIKKYLTDNFNTIHVDPSATITWMMKRNGAFDRPASHIILGSEEEVEFSCTILDHCGNKVEWTKTLTVLDPELEIIENILIQKFDPWLLVLHVNDLKNKYNLEFTEEDIEWYQIVDGIESQLENSGYYYTTDEALVGKFYVLINATNPSGCSAVIRSNTVDWSKPMNAPIRLVPNIGEEGTVMHLENLNPNNDYNIYGYNEAGKLVQTMSVSGQSSTDFRPEGRKGIYMLRVETDEKVETLRYIIK